MMNFGKLLRKNYGLEKNIASAKNPKIRRCYNGSAKGPVFCAGHDLLKEIRYRRVVIKMKE